MSYMDANQPLTVSKPDISYTQVQKRLLMGPGPGNAHPRVHAAMSIPQVGHMDPNFMEIVEELKSKLRYVWQTENAFTIPVSGTGSAAWEAAVANLTAKGDKVLVFVNGYFGIRHIDMVSRYGAEVVRVDKPWGEVFTFEEIKSAIETHKPTCMWICHAETSTGCCQNLEGVGDVCRANDCLLMVDTVTSIGGVPLFVDKWKIDACYAGTQKCLSCPPGVAPLTLGDRALAKMDERSKAGDVTKNWYLDMNMIRKYLVVESGAPRVYHHTAPISMVYAFREALTLIYEEGLENVWARHRANAEILWAELEKAGFELLVPLENRLPSLTTVKIPDGIDGKQVCGYLRNKYQIEIGGGLGELGGKVWRIGLMGYNSAPENALLCVNALKDACAQQRK